VVRLLIDVVVLFGVDIFIVLSFWFNVVWVLIFLILALLCFPTWSGMCYRGDDWSLDSTTVATPNLGENGMELGMRGEGRKMMGI
jgi:hypothetical protein